MMPGPGIKPGTIVVRGERSYRCAIRVWEVPYSKLVFFTIDVVKTVEMYHEKDRIIFFQWYT